MAKKKKTEEVVEESVDPVALAVEPVPSEVAKWVKQAEALLAAPHTRGFQGRVYQCLRDGVKLAKGQGTAEF